MEEATLFCFINAQCDTKCSPPRPHARAEHYKSMPRSLADHIHAVDEFTMESSLSPTVNDQSFRDASLNIEIEQAHETWEQDVLESPASVMQCCKGLRICSTVSDSIGTVLCDHSAEHSAEWSAVMNENNPCVEMGTVTNYHSVMIGRSALQDIRLQVQWDCGLERQYSLLNGEWRNLKAIDPAPTGLYFVC